MTWVNEGHKNLGWVALMALADCPTINWVALAPAEGGSIRREGSAGESLALAQWGRGLRWQRCWKFLHHLVFDNVFFFTFF